MIKTLLVKSEKEEGKDGTNLLGHASSRTRVSVTQLLNKNACLRYDKDGLLSKNAEEKTVLFFFFKKKINIVGVHRHLLVILYI